MSWTSRHIFYVIHAFKCLKIFIAGARFCKRYNIAVNTLVQWLVMQVADIFPKTSIKHEACAVVLWHLGVILTVNLMLGWSTLVNKKAVNQKYKTQMWQYILRRRYHILIISSRNLPRQAFTNSCGPLSLNVQHFCENHWHYGMEFLHIPFNVCMECWFRNCDRCPWHRHM